MTGSEADSFTEVDSILSQELASSNRHIIRYQPASIIAYFLHLFKRKMPPDRVPIQTILHVGLRFGQAEAVNTSLANLLGHQPHLLREYIRDNVDLWLRSAIFLTPIASRTDRNSIELSLHGNLSKLSIDV